ncbi:MAG: hypothetical protein V1913_04640 [Fibrobacterota bacterium]
MGYTIACIAVIVTFVLFLLLMLMIVSKLHALNSRISRLYTILDNFNKLEAQGAPESKAADNTNATEQGKK